MEIQSTAQERLERVAGQQPLYAALAGILSRDIRGGKHQPASVFPSEKELTERYGVSRQTVRQALRVLRDQGLISSHPGIGTIVRDAAQGRDRFNAVNSTEELLQFVGDTEMHAVSRREILVDAELAARLDCEPGSLLSEVAFLRKTPGAELPMSYVLIYVHPRYAAAQETPLVSSSPIYQNIERMFGVRVHEIRQDVTATLLDDKLAKVLEAMPGEAALQMTRYFYDENKTLIQVSISYYPSSRYTQSARFRVASSAP
ncbi:GntR family transcriptional regulator [Variovorax sp. J22R133]|uniref:GntR family transcriptional regulator n=1 Tax=Variovorax brevis TaxID=3053503 RepID=UPI00257794EC|nr:GntR family transcriptional regulator [Variovorax sp. J22R133]MDM0116025.1 GntR family transcriptional regulator [Variovorax sp. J22R133]